METRTIAQMRAIKNPGTTTKYCEPKDENYIAWQYDPYDKTTPDDGKTCIVTSTGKRIKKKMIINIVASTSGAGTPSSSTGDPVTPNPPAWIGSSPFNDTLNTATFIPSSGYAATEHEYRYKITGGSFGSWITATSNVISLPAADIAIGDLELRVKAATARNASSIITNSVAFTLIPDAPPTIVSATVTDTNTIQYVFSESVTATLAGHSFKKNGATHNPLSVDGSGTTWNFSVFTILSTDIITRSYNSTTGNTLDGGGNELASFTDQPVYNSLVSNPLSGMPGGLVNTGPSGTTAPGNTFTFNAPATPVGPTLAEWTRTADGGEYIAYTGDGLTGATTFKFYDGSTLSNGTVSTYDTRKGAVRLPGSGFKMYAGWAANGAGYGKPIAVNRTELLWVEKQVVAAQKAYLFGKNLAHNNNDDTSTSSDGYLYFQPTAGGTVTTATITKVTPYHYEYTVPALSAGSYNVWAHNGWGGDYGWSESKEVTIIAASSSVKFKTWGTTHNVGAASGTASTNVTNINAAVSAAGTGGNQVVFSSGTYTINAGLNLNHTTKWVGTVDGSGNPTTIIRLTSSVTSLFNSVPSMNQFYGIKFELNGQTISSEGFIHLSNPNIYFKNCTIDCRAVDKSVLRISDERIYFEDCTITGGSTDNTTVFMNGECRQNFIINCTFNWTNDTEASINAWGVQEFAILYSTSQDLDYSNGASGAGWGKGRWLAGNGIAGSALNNHFLYNTVVDAGLRSAYVDNNKGEVWLWENNLSNFIGNPSSSTSTTVTFTGSTPGTFDNTKIIQIVSGKGVGQSRVITGNTGSVITVDKPWNVNPDSTSLITIGSGGLDIVIYKNEFSGKEHIVTQKEHAASTAVNFYGGMSRCVFDDNYVFQLRTGMTNFATQHDEDSVDANMFNLFSRNTIEGVRWGVINNAIHDTTYDTTLPTAAIVGTVIRDNVINRRTTGYPGDDYMGNIDAGYIVSRDAYGYAAVDLVVYEGNVMNTTILNHQGALFGIAPATVPVGMVANQVFYNNTAP